MRRATFVGCGLGMRRAVFLYRFLLGSLKSMRIVGQHDEGDDGEEASFKLRVFFLHGEQEKKAPDSSSPLLLPLSCPFSSQGRSRTQRDFPS